MGAKRTIKLGQKVFVVLPATNEVERTMVGEIYVDGSYTLLNSCHHHWFTFEEALAAAQDQLKTRETNLRKQIALVRKKLKQVSTDETKQAVMAAPYTIANPHNKSNRRNHRKQKLKTVVVPSDYPNLGDMRYLAITPFSGTEALLYRPFPYFVLETKITSIYFSPDGKVHLSFWIPFQPEEYFTSREEAKQKLEGHLELGVCESDYFVSHAQMQEEIEKFYNENPPF